MLAPWGMQGADTWAGGWPERNKPMLAPLPTPHKLWERCTTYDRSNNTLPGGGGGADWATYVRRKLGEYALGHAGCFGAIACSLSTVPQLPPGANHKRKPTVGKSGIGKMTSLQEVADAKALLVVCGAGLRRNTVFCFVCQ
jgi:hypothetical protein